MVDATSTFDPAFHTHITRNGFPVVCIRFAEKIMGVVHDGNDGVFCAWDLKGKKLSIYPREDDVVHDLINYIESDGNG